MKDYYSFSNEFGNRLQEQMKKKGFTQEELAAKLSEKYMEYNINEEKYINRATIRSYIRGNTIPKGYELILLAELLECDVNYLLGISKNANMDVETAHQYTNLNYTSVQSLHYHPKQASFINTMFENESFQDITNRINNIHLLRIVETGIENYLSQKILKRMENYYIAYTCSVQTQFDAEGFISYLQNNFKYSNQDDICSLIQNSIHPNEFENFLNCHEKINNYWNHPIPKSNSEKEAFVELLTFLGENTFSYFSQITFRKIQEQKLLDIVNKEILNYIDNKTKERLSLFK